MANRTPKASLPGVRVFSYSVAGVLGLLLVSTTMPPIMGGTSDRAVINAPVELVTSPIKGVVAKMTLEPGDSVSAGEQLAVVRNYDVDRNKLIELQLNAAKLDSQIASDRDTAQDLKAAIARMDKMIAKQKAALVGQFQQEIDGAKANLAKKQAAAAIAKKTHAIDTTLHQKGVRGGDQLKSTKRVAIAKADAALAQAGLDSARQRLEASRNGIYLGPNADPINALLQQRRDRQNKLAEVEAELDSLKARKASIDQVRDNQQQRVATMAHRGIDVPSKGKILSVSVHNGSAVSNGDALARAVDCSDTFVVAIFSETQASNLTAGAPVTVSAEGWEKPVKGTVEQLVPRATATQNNNYAVPFPPTERRELYALIKLPQNSDTVGKGSCAVGKWVSVSLDNSLIPSTGDLTHMAAEVGHRIYSGSVHLYDVAMNNLPDMTDDAVATASNGLAQARGALSGLISEASAAVLDDSGQARPPQTTKRTKRPRHDTMLSAAGWPKRHLD